MVVAIIQARMSSTRLPGKVLMKVGNKVLLDYMIKRVRKSELIDKVVIATTINPSDDKIEDFCVNNSIDYFRGSENDVLDRYFLTAKKFNAKTVVRMTSDCPLVDPVIIDETIKLFFNKNVDYAANACPPDLKKYPDGSDVEVFSFYNLEKIWKKTTNTKDREHVTFYFWKYDHNFSLALLDNKYNWGEYRITVDYKEDFILISKIIKYLEANKLDGSLYEIISFLEKNPKIRKLNSQYTWGMNW